jgi:hypothetical protein
MSTEYHVAVIVYKSSSDSKDYIPLFEECITLIKATTESDARQKAEHLAKSRAATFKNQKGEEITWVLHKIIDINPMLKDSIGDVTEIYSRHFNNIDAYNAFETLAE